MDLVIALVAAAVVAGVCVAAFLAQRSIASIRGIKASLETFRADVEPAARQVIGLAQEAAGRAQGLPSSVDAVRAAWRP